MNIVFTARGDTWDAPIDPRFGRSEYLLVYNTESDELSVFDNRSISKEAHGAGPKTSQVLFEMGIDTLITGNGPGGNALAVLEKAKIKIYVGAQNMTVKEAYNAFKNNQLKTF
jgi:predicted Fe-Mo cluster-binding NifX family protein